MNFLKTMLISCLILAKASYAIAEGGINSEIANSVNHAFNMLLSISETQKFENHQGVKAKYRDFVKGFKIKQKKWNNDERLLKDLFYKVHRKYLKKYVPYQTFGEIFETGTYGCLTGSALYAFVLEELGYKYEIIETNFHMFLLVHANGQQFLLESTDPLNGFVSKADKIKVRIEEAVEKNESDENTNAFSYNIFRSISYVELIGLQYYNLAVDAYNHGKISKALYCLNEALKINKSERNEQLLEIIKSSIQNTKDVGSANDNANELVLTAVSL